MSKRRLHKKTGIVACLIICAAFLFDAIILDPFLEARSLLRTDADRYNKLLAKQTAGEIEETFGKIEAVSAVFKKVIEDSSLSQKQLQELAANWVVTVRELEKLTMAYEPENSNNEASNYEAFTVIKTGHSTSVETDLTKDSYNYPYWDWYQIPMVLQKPIWTPITSSDREGNKQTSYSIPFKKDKRGIINAEISLSFLEDIVGRMKFLQSGYCFVVSNTGRFVVHPNPTVMANETIHTIADKSKNKSVRKLITQMKTLKKGQIPFTNPLDKEEGEIFFYPIKSTKWSLGLFVPYREFTANVSILSQNIYVSISLVVFVLLFLELLWITAKEFLTHKKSA